jgi:tetrahydromethanopterin S-methyltransferase subunit H
MTAELESETEQGLLRFSSKQRTCQIGNVSVGGQPGVRPTLLIGSMFYHGQKVLLDEDRGEFDRDEAEKRIRLQEEFSQRTGNPCMLDVVGSTPKALRRHLEFAAEVTAVPLLVDGTTVEVRQAGLDYVAEAGLADRAVYNSIQPGIDDDELTSIQRAGVQSAIILTYYLQDFTSKGRLQAVRELLPRVRDAGITNVMIDTCVMDLATLGQAYSAMFDVKDELGLPAGGGVHNAVAMWRGLVPKMGEQAQKPCVASAAAGAVAVGADFVLYGPIEDAAYVFPAVAMVDTALSQVAIERGARPDKDHPRFRIG